MKQNADEIAANLQRARTSIQAAKDMLEKEYYDIAASRDTCAALPLRFATGTSCVWRSASEQSPHAMRLLRREDRPPRNPAEI